VTRQVLGEFTAPRHANTFLHFTNPEYRALLGGDPGNATIYGRAVQTGADTWVLMYMFLYEATAPYACCGNPRCFKFKSYAHLADWKATLYMVSTHEQKGEEDVRSTLTGAYYTAHGSLAGEYVDPDHIQWVQLDPSQRARPVIYPCFGDHSTYPSGGCYPRICGCVQDQCDGGVRCDSALEVVEDDQAPSFRWLNFAGSFNVDGISAPGGHNWYNPATLPKVSNGPCKRFCCPKFW
jgi:hypothetical protein